MTFAARYLMNMLAAPIYHQYKNLTLHNRTVRIRPQNWQTRSIFVHIPKTAGFSVAIDLYGRDPWHFSLVEYGAIADLGAFHSFTIVREPANRLNSMFHYLKTLRIVHPSATRLQSAGSFVEFVHLFADHCGPARYPFLRSQVDFTRLGDDPIGVDSVLRFERLEADYRDLRERLGLPASLLPRLNASASKVPLSRSDRSVVEKLLPQEYEIFGY